MDRATAVIVVGAGLAGSEAAWQLAQKGLSVRLYDMKPHNMSPAHHMEGLCELVCSNSLKANRVDSASGLLKQEMRALGSLVIEAADATKVPAGGALAVDRGLFSQYVTKRLREHPLIEVLSQRLEAIPGPPCVVASGPLTDGGLAADIERLTGAGSLFFYDAAAPIVTLESIDMGVAYRKSRYDKGGDDYINCPMTRAEYEAFVDALLAADTAPVHGFEENLLFEGCMPVESMARRGRDTLAFGPLKPKGLNDPRTGRMPHAVVQLRQDDASGEMYGLVGFQTRLLFAEQRRVFRMIPGLASAQFARYGVMHRNTFLRSPGFLGPDYQTLTRPGLYFAGQITGVEGYVESAASGLLAARSLAARLYGKPAPDFTCQTMIGALGRYIAAPNSAFQPMNANFSIIEPLAARYRNKKEKYAAYAQRSLAHIERLANG